ncbi:MAG: hypothetical protein ACPGYJ_07935, partial [bacterium]
TVEMFSIFHLGISNILPKGDLGFINAYKKYYNDKNLEKLDKLCWLGCDEYDDLKASIEAYQQGRKVSRY